MMFDSNQMLELAAISRDRYQRAGGGGAHKVYASSKAFHDARGHKDMSEWNRAVYEAMVRWRDVSRGAVANFKWECHSHSLDRDANGDVPF
jgi:hypothetical protein